MHDPDKTAVALAAMDPPSRALVELSYRRGLGDDEIADLLQVDPDEVARRRESALERLGVTGDELERLDDEHWAPRARPAATPPRSPAPAPRRRTRSVALALVAVIAALVLVVVIASRGGDDGDGGDGDAARTPTSSGTGATGAAEAKPDRPPQPMQRLLGTHGHGTAQLVRSGDRAVLRLNVTGFLQPQGGGYAVWLYNSPDDARRLYSTSATTIKRDIRLPRNFTRYRFAEVARAIPDLDSDHSGLSLLRARIAALAGS